MTNFDAKNEVVQDQSVQQELENPVMRQEWEGRLNPKAARMVQAPDPERVAMIISDHTIRYPAFDQVVNQAEWMINEPRQTRARGLVVCAQRNNGKSSLAATIHKMYNQYDRPDLPTAIKVDMTGVRDARSLYGRIMDEMGSPARISHRLSDRELIVQRLLRDVDCRLLILDEAQDILLGSEREQQRALEGLKLLMNKLGLPILAFGTEKAGTGFNGDPHLAARFKEYVLPTWGKNHALASFLATYERLLPLKNASNLASEENLTLLAKLGSGLLGKIVERIQNAALTAIVDGSERITKEHLIKASSRPETCLLSRGAEAK